MKVKIISVVAALSVLLSSFSASFAATGSTTAPSQGVFKDVNSHWAKDAIIKWSGYGIISGYGGLFRPNDSITRGEIACILSNMMDYKEAAENTYSDVKAGQFYTDAVLKAKAAGVLVDDGDAFIHPTDKITREESAVILAKAFAVEEDSIETTGFKDADSISSWAKSSVFGLEAKGYIKGNKEKFNPKANITRAEVVTIINNIVKAYYTKAGTYTDAVKGTAVIKVPDVILKGITISENLIIAEGVGKGDATLDSVTVKASTVVRGGGENSIHINGTSNITNIKIEKSSDKLRIVVTDGSTVQEVKIAKGEEIIITGSIGVLEIETADATIYATSANISNATIIGKNATIIVDKETKIGSVSVDKAAQNTTIKTEKGSVVGTVTAEAKTAIRGEGAVEKVVLNEGANNSNISTPNTQTKVAEGVTGATAGGGVPLAPGSTTTNNNTGSTTVTPPPSNGSSNGSSNGGGSVIPVSSITVAPTAITLTAGGATATITATLNPSNATNKNITWSSSNTNIATVNNGVVTPLKAGTTTISAISVADGTKSASTAVTVVADTTPPTLSNGTVENLGSQDGTTAVLKFQASQENGTVKYYYLVQDASDNAPNVDTIKASDKRGTASGNPTYYQINLSGLTAGQHYKAYIVMEDASGNTSNILTIIGIGPYSNATLQKLGIPSVTLSSNTTAAGGLAYTITSAIGADASQIKEYSLVIAASSAPAAPIITVTVPKSSLSGTVALANGITAGNSYVARVRAVVTDGNLLYQNSDFSANTSAAIAQAESVAEPIMQISYVSTFNKDSGDKSLQFSFSGSNNASASSLTIDTTKLKIKIGDTLHSLSSYSKTTTGLPGTYQLLYGETPGYVKIFLTNVDYNAIIGDADFTSAAGIQKLAAEAGWASINSIVSGQAAEVSMKFSRDLTIENNSDEFIAKYQLPQNYHYKMLGNIIQNVSYSSPSITFYSELVTDSGSQPTKGYKITKEIAANDSKISFSGSDVWERLSSEATPGNFAPTDKYYKVTAADTDQVVIEDNKYKVAQGVAGRINSLINFIKGTGEIEDRSSAFMFKFYANGKLEAIKVVGEATIGIDLVGHFAPVNGIPVFLESSSSSTAKLTVSGGNIIGDITVLNASQDYSERIWITGGSKVGDIILINGVNLSVSGYDGITQVGDVSGTGAYTVSVDVMSTNNGKVDIGDIALGDAGKLDFFQNNANDLSAEYFNIGNVTATTGGAIVIPNAVNEDCNPYGWFMKFSHLVDTVTFMIGINEVYTPPTSEITISGSDSFTPTINNGVFTYYDTIIGKWRFFFTDAAISSGDLAEDSKTFKFTAVDSITHKSNLITN